ncbi:MAG: hypothetical protein BWY37_01129 [Firmicutes bacterium ADurb.Bin262]|nr:MAG: hypothetical protein BWY37_01129 [Firmicutes bacterium ADurb.Bin262]
MHRFYSENRKNVMRISRAFGQGVAFFDNIPFFDFDTEAVRNHITSGVVVFLVGDDDMLALFDLVKGNDAADFGHDGQCLGFARLEKLLDQTLGDVGNVCFGTACLEGSHCQLRAGLADGLGRNNADRLADGDRIAGRQVGAVAFNTDPVFGAAGQQGADFDGGRTRLLCAFGIIFGKTSGGVIGHFFSVVFVHHDIFGVDDFACFRVDQVVDQVAADETVAQGDDDAVAVPEVIDFDACAAAAVLLADDDFLRHVDQTSGQVTGVSRSQSRVGEAFSRSARGDEVLEDV